MQTVTLHHYQHRDIVLGYHHWYRLDEHHGYDPYKTDYHGPEEYIVPDGFSIHETVAGTSAFYDADGNHYEFSELNGSPMIIGYKGGVTLKKLEAATHANP